MPGGEPVAQRALHHVDRRSRLFESGQNRLNAELADDRQRSHRNDQPEA